MSLMGTLAKVAVGVAVAKGAKSLMGGGATRGRSNSNGLFGGQHSPQSGGNPMDMIGGLLSGGQNGRSGQGGLGGILEQLTGAGGAQQQSGGLNGLLGGLAGQMGGGASAGAGGLGGLLGGLAGMAGASNSPSNNQGFGGLLNQAIANKGEPEVAPSADQEMVAGLMLVAMVQAAKSDGEIDKDEIANFTKDMGEIDAKEMEFLQAAMKSPVDIAGLVQQTPRGLEAQVYTVSVLGITLDSQAEAQYLHQLATAYKLSQDQVNNIHDQLGVPRLYN